MIVNNITEVKYVMRVSAATTYDMLSAHVANAELAFLIPLLGNKMYRALIAYHADTTKFHYTSPDLELAAASAQTSAGSDSGAQPSDKDKTWALLLWHAQHAVVHLAYFAGFDMLNAYISDGGFKRSESETIKSLYKYQEDNLKRYFVDAGMNSLDTMLEILDENMAWFEDFETQLREINSKIFPKARTFEQHYFINKSRLTFLRLQQHIKACEELELTPVVGAANMAYIYAELEKEAPAPKVQDLLPYLRDPLAYLSTAMLMQESGADLTERGLYFKGQKNITNSDLIMPAAEPRIMELVQRNKELGAMYLNRLKAFLMQSDQWGDYDSPRGRMINRDNDGKKIFVA